MRSFTDNFSLIYSLVRRDVIGRYQGSIAGVLWSFFNPILMLVVFTFVFSVVFKARWPGGSASKTEFAMVLFSGLLIYNLFAECVTRAPGLILSNVNYVKKVVFPLEILPYVALGTALFHMAVSLLVWFVFYTIFFGIPPVTILALPVLLLPMFILVLGLSWLLASLGVFLRDVGQVIGVLVMVLLYLSPIFYPVEILPERYQIWMHLSPLTYVVEDARNVMIWGRAPDLSSWLLFTLIACSISWLGFAWFQKTRKGFADVL